MRLLYGHAFPVNPFENHICFPTDTWREIESLFILRLRIYCESIHARICEAVANDVDLASGKRESRANSVRHARMYRSALTYQSAARSLRVTPAGISHLVERLEILLHDFHRPISYSATCTEYLLERLLMKIRMLQRKIFLERKSIAGSKGF